MVTHPCGNHTQLCQTWRSRARAQQSQTWLSRASAHTLCYLLTMCTLHTHTHTLASCMHAHTLSLHTHTHSLFTHTHTHSLHKTHRILVLPIELFSLPLVQLCGDEGDCPLYLRDDHCQTNSRSGSDCMQS